MLYMASSILRTEKLCKSFSNGGNQQHVIKNLDLEITEGSNDQLAMFRRGSCGFVFQSVYLLDDQTVLDNVLTGALIVQKNTPELVNKVKDLLRKVGLDEENWKKYPNQLSGGEAQRVGIVRAIINEPKILFADEPTGARNSASSRDVLDIFTEIHKNGQSIVMVTHDMKTALRGTRVLYLRDGGVVGDYRMKPYTDDDKQTRRAGLAAFLEEMGW